MPNYTVKAANDDTPVWKVAWIIVPQTIVYVGNNERTYSLSDDKKNHFIDTATFFKEFIETQTHNAVDIQIDIIEINIVPKFNSTNPDKVVISGRLSQEVKSNYNLENYDTWMVGWSLSENHQYYDENPGGATFDEREICLLLENPVLTVENYSEVCIHEFLHTAEFWFRDKLKFPLPYNVYNGINNIVGYIALHNSTYYGYGIQNGMTVNEAMALRWKWLADWLSCRVPDPLYPSPGHEIQYLGIPREAWNQSPTHITVTWQPNNGTAATSTVVHTGAQITAPDKPTNTDDYLFQGWYSDAEFKLKAVFPQYIIGDKTFYARWVSKGDGYIVPSDNPDAYIDLDQETLSLPPDFSMAAYSTDGGKKWTAGTILPAKFPAMLDKGLTLTVVNKYDAKTRLPASDADTITFTQVSARPKANAEQLQVNYSVYADPTGVTPGAWALARKGVGDAVYEGYQIALSSNGRTPDVDSDGNIWQPMPNDGIPVQPYGLPKQTYFVRSAPVVDNGTYIPASKTFKITPLVQTKAPNIKADYKNETIKPSAGMTIFGGSADQMKSAGSRTDAETTAGFDLGLYYTMQKTDKTGVSIKAILDATDYATQTKQTVCIWTPATDKKPATQIQEYILAIRADMPSVAILGTNVRNLPKTLEFYDRAKGKWGAIPAFTSSAELEGVIRLKADVRATGKDDSSQFAASRECNLTIDCGSIKVGSSDK